MPEASKRIVICADGTWNDPEDAYPTNVLRFARAIRPEDANGVQQVVFYDWGVGSYYGEIAGGVSGLGIMKNIQDCYRFVVQNYDPGDQIFLFGYSRGAYTVRALAGMLNNCGILTRPNAGLIPEAFDFYKKRSAKPGSAAAAAWRQARAVEPGRGIVHFIGVWDTVGALGIPTRVLAFVDERDLFFDTEIGSNVRVARHAVSIDEQRADFEPTLWGPKEAVDIRQVWFAGVHGDVGGGTRPKGGRSLSEIPLAWMAREAAAAGLALEPHLHGSVAGLHTADAHTSYKRFWKMLGSKVRQIPADGIVHRSVRDRFEALDYRPAPLTSWLSANGGWGTVES
ncbi:MAG: DUF2235 domain-containing protein [Pseudomonadales bacterium]